MENKSLCKLLWMHLAIDTTGQVKPCCISTDIIRKPNGEAYNFGYDSLDEIYNSQDMIRIRQDMLDGKPIAGCSQCYVHEEAGGKSSRQSYNYDYRDVPSDSAVADGNITSIDLRFGNLCNLSCRSCTPSSSSQLASEIAVLPKKILKYHSLPDIDTNSWYQTETFTQNLDSQLENLEMVYITGGEPTVIKQNLDLMERLVASGRSNDVILKLNTNLTNTNKRFYDLLKHFKCVLIFASVDGYGNMQEYLRFPSKWSTIDANINRLLSLGDNVFVVPSPVIQTTNLSRITELLDYFENFNRQAGRNVVQISPIILQNPDYLNLVYLPLDYKLSCWNTIQEWLSTVKYQSPSFHWIMRGLETRCKMDQFSEKQLRDYVEYNSIFDSQRRTSLAEVNPELSKLLEQFT